MFDMFGQENAGPGALHLISHPRMPMFSPVSHGIPWYPQVLPQIGIPVHLLSASKGSSAHPNSQRTRGSWRFHDFQEENVIKTSLEISWCWWVFAEHDWNRLKYNEIGGLKERGVLLKKWKLRDIGIHLRHVSGIHWIHCGKHWIHPCSEIWEAETFILLIYIYLYYRSFFQDVR